MKYLLPLLAFIPFVASAQYYTEVYEGEWESVWVESYRIDDIAEIAAEYQINPFDLLSKCIKESLGWENELLVACRDQAVGDYGWSHGAFQIHLGFHPAVTEEMARDFRWALDWTAQRMIRMNYLADPGYAIMRHNGANEQAREYAEDVMRYSRTIAQQFPDLFINR